MAIPTLASAVYILCWEIQEGRLFSKGRQITHFGITWSYLKCAPVVVRSSEGICIGLMSAWSVYYIADGRFLLLFMVNKTQACTVFDSRVSSCYRRLRCDFRKDAPGHVATFETQYKGGISNALFADICSALSTTRRRRHNPTRDPTNSLMNFLYLWQRKSTACRNARITQHNTRLSHVVRRSERSRSCRVRLSHPRVNQIHVTLIGRRN